VSLKDAWHEFAYPDLQARIREPSDLPTFDPSVSAMEKFQFTAQVLAEIKRLHDAKKEAVEYIRTRLAVGDLVATGLPPPTAGRFERVSIEDAFWDAASIDVEAGSAMAMGIKYVAVRVFSAPVSQAEPAHLTEPSSDFKCERVVQPAASDLPSMAGATSFEDIRSAAILYCFRTHADFGKFKLDRRLQMVVDYVDTNHPEIDTSWGFDRSSFYATVKNLKSAGLLPSKNVQG